MGGRQEVIVIGLISDTHGLLRPEIFTSLAGVDRILHAGDIGPDELLIELEAIAPVTAVWGNTDGWELRERLPEVARVEIEGVDCRVMHGHQLGSPTPEAIAERFPEAGMVVFGHSHQALIRRVGTVCTVNPGSAGPKRFRTVPTLAIARVEDEAVQVELISLERAQS